MIPITPLTIVIFQIVAAYAVVWLVLKIWRWFVAWCMEIVN